MRLKMGSGFPAFGGYFLLSLPRGSPGISSPLLAAVFYLSLG